MAKKTEIPSLDEALHTALDARFEGTDVLIGTADQVGYLSAVQEWVPTGIFWLDLLLSRGKGLPVGRFMEVFGQEEAGKTALCEFIAGRYVHGFKSKPHWMDYERSLDWDHFACYRVEEGQLYTPDLYTLEQGWDYIGTTLDTMEARIVPLAKAKLPPDPPALFVVDSIAAATPKAELEEETSEAKHMAETARAMSKGFRKYLRRVAKSRSTVIFTNQVRDKMNAKPGQKMTTQPGGRAAKFGCSIRLEVIRTEGIEGKEKRQVGHIVKVVAVKNRHAPSRMSCELVLSYTRGFDVHWSNFVFFQKFGYIAPAGTAGYKWAPHGKEAVPFKRINFGAWCAENPEVVAKARDAIYEKELAQYATSPATDLEESDDDDDAPITAGGAESD